MPKSKIFLPDVNFWLAFCADGHQHHEAAVRCLDGLEPRAAAFCRVTQMGLLRLLTNTRVMGADALSEESAWRVFFELAKDSRVTFAEEPEGIEWEWKRLTSRRTAGASRWTDAYLQAFAGLREMRVLTFDRGFLAWPEPPAQILS